MSRSPWSDNKPDEVWTQVGDGPRTRAGITRFKPTTQWCKDNGVDVKKIISVAWSDYLKGWVIKMKP